MGSDRGSAGAIDNVWLITLATPRITVATEKAVARIVSKHGG